MNLQIIISGDGWVLDKYARILADGCGGVVRTEPEAVGSDGITYLMNYAQVRKLVQGVNYGEVVSMVTHVEWENIRLMGFLRVACDVSSAVVAMSAITASEIDDACHSKRYTIPLPVRDCFTKRRPRIGIAACRNAGNERRKGWDLVDRLAAEHPEWEISITNGVLLDAELVDWYRSLDLYLCPSRYEGGPMGVVEARTMDIPVVVPRGVGWCDSVLHGASRFDAGDYDDMAKRIRFALPSLGGAHDTERDYIAAHNTLFTSLLP